MGSKVRPVLGEEEINTQGGEQRFGSTLKENNCYILSMNPTAFDYLYSVVLERWVARSGLSWERKRLTPRDEN